MKKVLCIAAIFLSSVYLVITALANKPPAPLELHTYIFTDSTHRIKGFVQVFQSKSTYSVGHGWAAGYAVDQLNETDLQDYPVSKTGQPLLIGQLAPGYPRP